MRKFWIQFGITILFGLIAPLTYLFIRFNLYNIKQTINLWAIISIAIIFIAGGYMLKYIFSIKTKYYYYVQIVKGVVKVILPLLFVLIFAIWFKGKTELLVKNLHLFIEALIVIIGCEAIAICVNPLPKWAFENNVEGFTDIMSSAIKKSKEE